MTTKQFLCENFSLFKDISDEDLNKILSHDGIREECYLPNEIMQNNSLSDKIGIICKGKAIIKSGDDGVIIKKLGKSDVYGAAALFDKPEHLTVVKAQTECSVITISKSFIKNCILTSSAFALNYVEFLSKRISFLNSKINAYTAKSAENKLYTYLLQLPRTGNEIILTNDMSTIAKMLAIGRASLYRAVKNLENNGLITKQDKKIILNEV